FLSPSMLHQHPSFPHQNASASPQDRATRTNPHDQMFRATRTSPLVRTVMVWDFTLVPPPPHPHPLLSTSLVPSNIRHTFVTHSNVNHNREVLSNLAILTPPAPHNNASGLHHAPTLHRSPRNHSQPLIQHYPVKMQRRKKPIKTISRYYEPITSGPCQYTL